MLLLSICNISGLSCVYTLILMLKCFSIKSVSSFFLSYSSLLINVDYSQAKIYKVTDDFNTDIWIGSTCDTSVKKISVKPTLLEILETTVYFII